MAAQWAGNRTLRIADGPDEVHRNAIAKLELAKHMSIPKGELDLPVTRS
jgi:acyl-CoA dehydrogenase